MNEYIDRDEALAIIENWQKDLCPIGRYGRGYVYGIERDKYDEIEAVLDEVKAIPAADVAPMRHGRWVDFDGESYECSMCHGIRSLYRYSYCPDCGARMDGGDDDGE